MSRPAFIVEGDQEQKVIQQICPGIPVVKHRTNGKTVELAVAAKVISSLINIRYRNHYPIIVLFDRESRTESVVAIKKQLSELIKDATGNIQLIVGIPDRMIENWLLADPRNIADKLKGTHSRMSEGVNGKAFIKKNICTKNTYHETVEGVEWFLTASSKEMYKNSTSFKSFIDDLFSTSFKCKSKWMKACLSAIK